MLKESNNDVFYIFTAKPSPWVGNVPPSVDESAFAYDNEIFKNIISGKIISNTDIIPVVPRINWTPNTVYDKYDSTKISENANLQFYVLTNEKRVFKCIDNNKNSPSVVEPFLDSRKTFKTSDGYSWRYLYSISEFDWDKFTTSKFIPITPNSSITAFAIPGTIDNIEVISGGENYYTYHVGNTSAVIDNSNFVIEPTASANDNFYTDSSIYFKGDLIGATSNIISYNGTTKTISVDPPISLRVELLLANAGTGVFYSNLIARQEYFEILNSNTVGPAVVPDLAIAQINPLNGANLNYVVVDTFDGGMRIIRSNTAAPISLTEPWRATSGESVPPGLVTTTLGTNTVTGTSGTLFSDNFVVGDFIRVGSETRQIAAISGASSITTSQSWSTSFAANVYVKPLRAGYFLSATRRNSQGLIDSTDVSAAKIYLGSTSGAFLGGEEVYQANSSGTIATGLVLETNSTSIYVGNITGSFTYASNLVIKGTTSGTEGIIRANNGIISTPRLLITNSIGSWYSGNVSAVTLSNSEVGSAKILSITSFPGVGTPYIISPKVVIKGDGVGASAYSVVNTSNYTIDSVVVINQGNNYSYANTYLEANSIYGSNASISSLISPVGGVGANVQNELNSRHTEISVQFQNSSSEGYYFSTNSEFHQIGIIKNPQFSNITLTVGEFVRTAITLDTVSGIFERGEVVFQPSINAVATVVYANSTYMEVENMSLVFEANTNIIGYNTGSTANVLTVTALSFPVNTSITQTIYQDSTEANATLVSANSTIINITGVSGQFTNSSITTEDDYYRGARGLIYDKTSNSYATISDISNNRKPTNFDFTKFNQTHRIAVDNIVGTFINNERVYQDNLSGFILNSNTDIDLSITGVSDNFVVGDFITQTTTGATAVVITANSTYLRASSANGVFLPGYEIVAIGSGSNAISSAVYNVITLYGVDGNFDINSSNIIGETSNAQAITVSNKSLAPDLVKNTGEVLYIQNSTSVLKSATSREQIKIVVQYL